MKKLLIFISMIALAACSKDLISLNDDPKNPTDVPSFTLFSNAQKNLANIMTTPSVNSNIFRLISQQWAQTTYTDESRYDLGTRNIPQTFWNTIYRDVLGDLQEAKRLILLDNSYSDQQERRNELAITDVMQVYSFYVLVATFGDVPYSKALDYTIGSPEYDPQSAIVPALIARLDTSLAAMDEDADSYEDADLIYGGDVVSWKRFANSLKLKLGILLADADAQAAKSAIESAAAGAFTDNSHNATFKFLSVPPNTNPVWVELIQSNRNDFVAANTFIDVMNTRNDPRRAYYFTPVDGGTYVGGIYGSGNSYDSYSHASGKITDPAFEGLLLDYAEVEFILAEAIERGFNVGGTAASHYNKGVVASVTYWGGTDATAQAYLLQPNVAYATAPGNWKAKIGVQQWLAYYNRGFDGWVAWRRLDAPVFNVPSGLTAADIPVRYTYPVTEQNINTLNYDKAAASVGGDEVGSKLFWDKF
ncbi:SusD/RagB family nutrient-binding outer membrane lipoprotein [Chitinophaga horti]|uniref:SusD/RagB family nutrient-binding outer membrane lipoprotein n=1 Tax=Chitinophaga horti TaxID=2920382 RepID=A0ABY6IZM4_9BACT|nr:SusD/RagB family nutrient-binding outer membrane lipoprotein [Chitinophaga horti]UYQ91852.1 SusD/RagB family nutrient-binding outer membrane lipoprotein [Chitinophaga horti]